MSSAAGTSASANAHGGAAHNDTEQALAEVELLAQNQRKLGALTNRMTSILAGFDRRLIKLESTMLPIHRSTQTLIRIQDNVDAVLHSLNKTLGHYDVVQDEEPILRKGPSVRNPQPYLDTIKRVQDGLDYLSRSQLQSQQKVMLHMNDLIELGSRNVGDMIKDWVGAESPAEGIDVRADELQGLSSATVEAVVPLLSFLKSLPAHPKTHHSPFSSALVGYSELRSKCMDASLAPLAQQVVRYARERVGSSGGHLGMTAAWQHAEEEASHARGSSGLSTWVDAMMNMAENEYAILSDLLKRLTPPSSTTTIHSTFSRLLRTPLRSFSSTLSEVHGEIRRNASTTHCFYAFDVIGILTAATPRWDEVVIANCSRQSDSSSNSIDSSLMHSLSQTLIAVRGTAMEIFPSVIANINAMPQQREGEVPSTSVNEITYSTLTFMRQLCEYADVVAPLLNSLGAGMWMMGSDRAPVLSLDIGSEQGILSQYLADILAALLNALEARSRAIRQPSTASIFVLNNVGHLRQEISQGLDENGNAYEGSLFDYLGQPGSELLEGALRSATTAYLDAWNPVVSPLVDDTLPSGGSKAASKIAAMGGGAERAAIKDRFAKFFEGIEDLERLHRAYPLSREDAALKNKLRNDVLRMVCPLYNRFASKHRTGEFSKNPSKYIRMSEAEVEERISSMFN